MLLIIILSFISILLIILSCINFDKFGFWLVFAIPCLFALLVSLFGIRLNNNPELECFNELTIKYEFILKQDSIPFKIKNELYEECIGFNQKFDDNKKYSNNVWVGIYYPQIESETIKKFDLTKIK